MRYVIATVLMAVIGGCDAVAPKPTGDTAAQARFVGQQYLKERNAEWLREEKAEGHPEVVIDRGTYWEYTFELPPNMVGGVPVVEIEKVTMRVINAYHTQ